VAVRLCPTAALLAVLVMVLAGCGARGQTHSAPRHAAFLVTSAPSAHPQAVEPVAGTAGARGGGSASNGGGGAGAPDVANATAGGVAAISVGSASGSLPQPTSDAQIRRELAASGVNARAGRATLTPSGLAVPPVNAPPVIQAMIAAGNQIAHLPYRFGGGHGTFSDTAYDCSGSLSFVFAAARVLNTTVNSGQLMGMGQGGPGKWVTIFANSGHTFMYVAGLRFDTVALAQTGTRWSDRAANEPDLASFVVRHPPGL